MKDLELENRVPFFGNIIDNNFDVPSFSCNATKAKAMLRAGSFPKDKTKIFINYFFDKQKTIIESKINKDDNPLLLIVPSTSNANLLPQLFANEIKAIREKCVIKNNVGYIRNYAYEVKYATSLAKRLAIGVSFTLDVKSIQNECKGFSNIFLVDDVANTGETAITLATQLKNEANVKVTGALSLIPLCIEYPTKEDINLFVQKLGVRANLNQNQIKTLAPKAIDVFHPFLKKMYEREKINTPEKAMECYQSIEKAYSLLENKKRL